MNSLDPNSREVLRAGRAAEGPTAADQERVRQKLAVALAAGMTGPAIAAPAATAAKWWASRTVLGGAGLASVVVVGVTAVVMTRTPAVEPPAPSVTATAPPAPVVEPVEPSEPQAAPASPEEPVDPPSAVAPKKPVKRVKRQPPSSARSEPVPVPQPIVTAPVAEPTPDELEAETQGLKEVQLALRANDPRRALTLLDQQDARFTRGQLKQEREGARVLATCATEPSAGAAAFERFRLAHPASPLLTRLKAACSR